MAVDAPPERSRIEALRPRRGGVPVPAALAFALGIGVLSWGVSAWFHDREDAPGPVDVGFYDDMTTHHYQAIEMANVYVRNGDDPLLREVAAKISFAQAGDIREMQRALVEWDETGTPDVAMEWMGTPVDQHAQPGMASAAELDQLVEARGSQLDDLFSRLMIEHHEGGIHMAEVAAERARLGDVRELARVMAASQREEIDELGRRRVELGLGPLGGGGGR